MMKMNKYHIRLLADQSLQCGEGPLWDGPAKRIFWTDSSGDEIFYSDSNHSPFQLYSKGIHAASLALHREGGLMLCGKEGFYHLSGEGKLRMVSDNCEGIAVNHINDIIADPMGRVFGGQEVFSEDHEYQPGYLFRVDAHRQVKIVEEGLHLSNGMGFSPSADRFYLTDTIARHIYEYDYDLATGDISNKKILITLSQDDGLPDGLSIDAEGFIWVARWFGNGLSRYDPDGKLERKIELPVAQVSSLTFGGADYNEIFVTTAAVNWKSTLAPKGHDFLTPRGGGVYQIVQDIQGKPSFCAEV